MSREKDWKEFVVFNAISFMDSDDKTEDQAESILGIVRSENKIQAQDTASAVFPDMNVFVLSWEESSPEFKAAGEKRGYLNTSQAHEPGFMPPD